MLTDSSWHPSAALTTLRLRASLLGIIRSFFAERDVLEVDTPALSKASVSDPNLHSFITHYQGPGQAHGQALYLQTSPEFPMKRLLAAGSGSIYQISKVFRNGENGRYHNPEFTLLEWYRVGFDHYQLMKEVEALINACLSNKMTLQPSQRWSYRQIFLHYLNIDPLTASIAELRHCCLNQNITLYDAIPEHDTDPWLDLLLSHCIEPQLDRNRLCFIYDYPASQAALARLKPNDPELAERFEVYLNGIELANGFHELNDPEEQRQRFENDNRARQEQGLPCIPIDQNLLAALSSLPDCAGVALGLDRLLLIASSQTNLSDTLSFSFERA